MINNHTLPNISKIDKNASSLIDSVIVKNLGICPYQEIWHQMQTFTKQRTATTYDEIWQLQHHPVYTLGQAGLSKHIIDPQNIPIIKCDRGGQVTYHGPGQLIIYLLCNLQRKKLSIKQVIATLQKSVIDLLANYMIIAHTDHANPGVYVEQAKICSIGLKVHKGCLYHGLSLNVAMDLEPFTRINPCGQPNLMVTQLNNFGINDDIKVIGDSLVAVLKEYLGYK